MNRARGIIVLLIVLFTCTLCMLPQYPVWMTNQQHLKQNECRRSLRAVMNAFASAADAGTKPTLEELAKSVDAERRHPYTYVLSDDVTVAARKNAPNPDELARQLKLVRDNVHPGLSSETGALTIACVANTDDDEHVDLLSVSSVERYKFGDLPVRALEIELQANDFPGEAVQPVTFEAVKTK
ncbi:MAG: hypothetical protein JNM17_14185 [Archangium sp.]|nr:hypothetical protein [Archangium sp.]